ncbi:four helix bundle protein [Nonlabens ponticola]|uniref:Four helix bundle protein n=1 Tax=Nonlabens ponticola TaxID=2496866 RepID=A0A3S9N0K8_9FLAO|nr:four helix bundle protein [Nonlabens ponticola]AZQ44928.1 four helix bundle protein [Nonlabens ponticola]
MAHYKSFEELEIWQRARIICDDVYNLYLVSDLQKDYGLWNQINKSSGSIMDNIAEGFDRDGNREFIQFLSISKASCGEAKSQLYRCFDRKYLEPQEFEDIKRKMEECKAQIAGFMKYLKNSDRKGNKYD